MPHRQEAYAIVRQFDPIEDSRPDIDAFVENLPGNVYRRVRRPDGTYHFDYLSKGLFRQFGIDNERLLAEPTIRFDWVHPDDRGRMVSDLEFSAATLSLLDHRVRIVGEDGRVHWARGIARPSRLADGSTVWDGLVIDVTREIEAEAALRVAKDEADRAHRLAARSMGELAERLGPPVGLLRQLLDRGTLAEPEQTMLRTIEAQLAALLGGMAVREPIIANRAAMTRRQQDVLALMRKGLSNKAIAAALKITPGTAKLHVASVLRILGASSRREIAQSV